MLVCYYIIIIQNFWKKCVLYAIEDVGESAHQLPFFVEI